MSFVHFASVATTLILSVNAFASDSDTITCKRRGSTGPRTFIQFQITNVDSDAPVIGGQYTALPTYKVKNPNSSNPNDMITLSFHEFGTASADSLSYDEGVAFTTTRSSNLNLPNTTVNLVAGYVGPFWKEYNGTIGLSFEGGSENYRVHCTQPIIPQN